MRVKFVSAVLLAAAVILGAALYLKEHLKQVTTLGSSKRIDSPLADSNSLSPLAPAEASATAPTAANALTPEQQQEAVDLEIDRLQQWSMNDDPASLDNILSDLASPNKEVREAAVEAVKEFGNTNAIPALKAAAEHADDPREKVALIEAAEFLALPPLSFDGERLTPEQIQAGEQSRAQKLVNRQARAQRSAAQPTP